MKFQATFQKGHQHITCIFIKYGYISLSSDVFLQSNLTNMLRNPTGSDTVMILESLLRSKETSPPCSALQVATLEKYTPKRPKIRMDMQFYPQWVHEVNSVYHRTISSHELNSMPW